MKLPLKQFFYKCRDTESVDGSRSQVHHIIDQLNLWDDGSSAGALNQGLDVTDSQANQEVHDDDGEQNDIGSKEEVGGSWEITFIMIIIHS